MTNANSQKEVKMSEVEIRKLEAHHRAAGHHDGGKATPRKRDAPGFVEHYGYPRADEGGNDRSGRGMPGC